MKTYKVAITREGKWWMVAIPELNGLTQARRLSEAELMAKEWIAATLDLNVDDVNVEIIIDRIADVDVWNWVTEIKTLRGNAADLEARARSRTEDLARRLADADVPVRDIGTILGVSFQRAHQLVTAGGGK